VTLTVQEIIDRYFKSIIVNDNQNFCEFIVEPKNNLTIEEAFERLYVELVGRHNYAIILFKDNDNYVLRVSKKEMKPSSRRRRIIIIMLFMATIVSVAYAGHLTTQYFNFAVSSIGLSNLKLSSSLGILFFTLAVIAPIITHELSHYCAAKKFMTPVTPPALIPAPLISPLGTFGAIIGMRHLPKSLKDLIRIGLAGPLAGTIASYILFTVMYILSPTVSYSTVAKAVSEGLLRELRILPLGSALIMRFIDTLRWGGEGMNLVILNPPALAALFIILIHFINLLPLGHLDGGHVFRGLTNTYMHRLTGLITLATALIIAIFVPNLLWLGIFVMLAFLITGLREHPGAANLESMLPRTEKLKYFTIYVILLLITAPIII